MTIDEIAEEVAFHTGVKVERMRMWQKHQAVALPRHMAMFLARKLTKASFPEIAAWFGGRHHTTVMSACRNVERLWKQSGEFAGTLDGIELVLEARRKAHAAAERERYESLKREDLCPKCMGPAGSGRVVCEFCTAAVMARRDPVVHKRACREWRQQKRSAA